LPEKSKQEMPPHIDSMSPFEDLNGFRYHNNWLRNFLIAASLNGRGTAKPNKHKLTAIFRLINHKEHGDSGVRSQEIMADSTENGCN
jgi:hypothetical protein